MKRLLPGITPVFRSENDLFQRVTQLSLGILLLFFGIIQLSLGILLLFFGVTQLFLEILLLFLGVIQLFLGILLLFPGVIQLFLGILLLFPGVIQLFRLINPVCSEINGCSFYECSLSPCGELSYTGIFRVSTIYFLTAKHNKNARLHSTERCRI